jgi:propanol-preferring alcohol dehydrogenase
MAIPEKTNKAVVYAAPGTSKTKIENLEIPEPGSGQILVNMQVF